MNERIRAVIYARYSSHNQDEISIEDQIAICKKYIEDMGWELVGIYHDNAKTGTNDKRDDFRRMMADARNDEFDIVAIWHTNRLHRSMINSFVMLAELMKYGKDFRSTTQRDLNDPKSDLRLLMYALYAWKDEGYSKDLSADVKRGQYAKAEKCHPVGMLRYGWDIAGARIDEQGRFHPGDHYEINEREAEAVRMMFRMRSRGHTCLSCATKLNELGYCNKYGRPIRGAMVARIIRNPVYKGIYSFAHIRIEGGIPAIVTEREWKAAQDGNRRTTAKNRKKIFIEPEMEFGNLRVIEFAYKQGPHRKFLCECTACGGRKVEWGMRLTGGLATDCGCISGADGRKRNERGRFI